MIDWIMYAKIQDLKRQKYKKAKAAKKLHINRETVTKYWNMTPEEYEAICNKHRERKPDKLSRVKLFFSPTAIQPQIKSDISLFLSALM